MMRHNKGRNKLPMDERQIDPLKFLLIDSLNNGWTSKLQKINPPLCKVHLMNGNFEHFVNLFSQTESFSSRVNRAQSEIKY